MYSDLDVVVLVCIGKLVSSLGTEAEKLLYARPLYPPLKCVTFPAIPGGRGGGVSITLPDLDCVFVDDDQDIAWYPREKVNTAKKKFLGANPAYITRYIKPLFLEL